MDELATAADRVHLDEDKLFSCYLHDCSMCIQLSLSYTKYIKHTYILDYIQTYKEKQKGQHTKKKRSFSVSRGFQTRQR
jgi:hypothetical protein